MSSVRPQVSGAQALAYGAIEAGVRLVLGYPGSPTTAVVDEIARRTGAEQVRVEWTSNEKVAVEAAFGGSLAGVRSLLCVKSVGLNVALDPLMAINLCGCHAGMVLLVGDDPGGWGSQNEQDSRALGVALEIPLLEPPTVADARAAMHEAFALSTALGVPVMVRTTRALAEARAELPPLSAFAPPVQSFRRAFMEWVVLPVNVVSRHHRLHERLQAARAQFDQSSTNRVQGRGPTGIVAAGYAYQKLIDLLQEPIPSDLSILALGTPHPLPLTTVDRFAQRVDTILVLEETTPVVERALRARVQLSGCKVPIYGRETGHVAVAGELLGADIAGALERLHPGLSGLPREESSRAMPSRRRLCEGCPYIRVFEALLSAIERQGGRDDAIIVGDPGCMVRAQLPPYELLDVKYSLGSSIGTAAGLSLGQALLPERARHVIALCGDSGLLHTGLNGLMDAARLETSMLVVVLDNGTTALTGGQPHPGTGCDLRGTPAPAVDLAEVVTAVGVRAACVVKSQDREALERAFVRGLGQEGLAVVIAKGVCPQYGSGAKLGV
jgi:indolepyruvate ferredoxin oxidoreductase, alpha subunit